MNPSAGAAVPVSISTADPQGNVALPVYGYSSQPTDRPVQGGPAVPVKVLSASDLIQNGGTYRLEGRPFALPVMTAPATIPVLGQRPIAVYPVNSWGNSTPVLPQVASATLLLDLRASQLALNDGDPVSTWADTSGSGNDFTQSGSARPTYRTGGGVPYVEFDGVEDWMLGQNWAALDNLDSFAIFASLNLSDDAGLNIIGKYYDSSFDSNQRGWVFEDGVPEILIQKDGSNYLDSTDVGTPVYDTNVILSGEIITRTSATVYQDGVLNLNPYFLSGTVDTFASSAPVWLGCVLGAGNAPTQNQSFLKASVRAILIYQITDYTAWNATDRAAIETWLATNP